ncbi:hypothetical protein NHQ30_010764 [Ciborinia camelliae]|nr:hypothetical protein NHQ30_010764 [Ciborinia camelliae]
MAMIASGRYTYETLRAVTKIRGGLVTIIYSTTQNLHSTAIEESASSSLISTDVERIAQCLELFHNLWATPIELAIAIYLLERQLGAACVIPVILALADVTSILGPVATFALFTIIGRVRGDHALLVTQAFTSLTVLSLIGSPLLIMIQTFPQMMSAVGSFTRIQEFLTSECRKDDRICLQDSPTHHNFVSANVSVGAHSSRADITEMKPLATTKSSNSKGTAISVVDATFGWTKSGQATLEEINIVIQASSLTMIVGPVGCGKSTLVKSFLGETRVSKGFVYVSSREMSFCDQSSWLYNATARQNIIGVYDFEPLWYETVINACALQKDMYDLPLGDETIIGSRGTALSGGQKQRIAIARAIYSRKKIAIFDDVLTGLDATTEEQVFYNVFGPGGLFKKLGTTVILVTNKVHRLGAANHIIAIGQQQKVLEQGDFTQLKSAGGYVSRLLSQEEPEISVEKENTKPEKEATIMKEIETASSTELDNKRQKGDLSIYKYFCNVSGPRNVALALSMAVLSAFCTVYSTFWLQKWVNANQQSPNKDVALYLCVYALLGVAALVALWVFCWQIFLVVIPRSGQILHQNMLKSTLEAPLSFLTTTDVGTTMNRFSQDMQLIDSNLQGSSINTIEGIVLTIMRVIIVCVTAKYFAVTIPFGLGAVYLIQRYYLLTSRQLRLLDIEARAPLYSHFLETLDGLATIRAYGWQSALQKQNHDLMDAAQKPFYLLACIQQWLAFVLDILTAVLVVIVVVFAVTVRSSMTGGDVGVALVNIVSTNQALAMLIISWTGLETAIGAVSRVRSFSRDTPSEIRSDVEEIDLEEWPSSGTISFENVSASYRYTNLKRYSSDSPPVLKNINMSIASGEKIGVCGRTGRQVIIYKTKAVHIPTNSSRSGKSSLILCLLQMLDVQSGSIKIDNIDLASLPRESVRTSLNTISQDAVLIEGTIRLNLDPSSAVSDDTIIAALKKVQLWDLIQKQGSLDARSTDVHLSHGQRQLFCLARALIRKGKILLLDEATSSIDSETAKVMQELIREEFKDCTIISVDHTLDNIIGFDRIAFFDTGVLMEFDTPAELMGKASGFKALYDRGT